ncbi:hypothetical protein BHE74_00010864 [Ensete ventricosum]|nr:hypothetical protein GW17_00027801 [Ensete ventricosum]RWW80780.1 hypothetical protein BHE74_00010864 [Ensete ventricosum]
MMSVPCSSVLEPDFHLPWPQVELLGQRQLLLLLTKETSESFMEHTPATPLLRGREREAYSAEGGVLLEAFLEDGRLVLGEAELLAGTVAVAVAFLLVAGSAGAGWLGIVLCFALRWSLAAHTGDGAVGRRRVRLHAVRPPCCRPRRWRLVHVDRSQPTSRLSCSASFCSVQHTYITLSFLRTANQTMSTMVETVPERKRRRRLQC